jgi:UDP-N-acetylmuramyl pentapeptide phosphotransferase/UDP-N-acetylglucosamine-1-phosphate transferase
MSVFTSSLMMVLGCLDDIAKVRRGKRERGVSDLSPIFVALIFGVVSGHRLESRKIIKYVTIYIKAKCF